jgi:hypothetical protein
MGRTYRECPACGKHALSIATRCPVCGRELLDEPVRRQAPPDRGRLGPALGVGAFVVIVGAGVALLIQRGAAHTPEAISTAELRAETPVAIESRAAAPALTRAEPARAAVPDSAPSVAAVSRVARTWTRVHERRSVKSDLSAVLLPGDTVLADSLRGGWWRVALEGKVIGYVYGPTLAETP